MEVVASKKFEAFSWLALTYALDLDITYGVVLTGTLNDEYSIRRCHQLGFIRDFLNFVRQNIFGHTITGGEFIIVNTFNLVFHTVELITCDIEA